MGDDSYPPVYDMVAAFKAAREHGRRLGLEEAASVADREHQRAHDDDEWAAGYRAACLYFADTIRALMLEGK